MIKKICMKVAVIFLFLTICILLSLLSAIFVCLLANTQPNSNYILMAMPLSMMVVYGAYAYIHGEIK